MVTKHLSGLQTVAAVVVCLVMTVVLNTSSAQEMQVPQWEYGILAAEEFFGEQGEHVGITSSYTWTASGAFHTGETLTDLLVELSGDNGAIIDLYNYLGQQGWELITVVARPPRPIIPATGRLPQGMLVTDIQWIFKRPVRPEQ